MVFARLYNVKSIYKMLNLSGHANKLSKLRSASIICVPLRNLTRTKYSYQNINSNNYSGSFKYITLTTTITLSNSDNDEVPITRMPNFEEDGDKYFNSRASPSRSVDDLIFNEFFKPLSFSSSKDRNDKSSFNDLAPESSEDPWKKNFLDYLKNEVSKSQPLWLVLSNTTPTAFGNLYMSVCGIVFVLWKLGDNLKSRTLSDFMYRHFVATHESFTPSRFHTFLTSGVSHTSFTHFVFNCMMFQQLIATFNNNMLNINGGSLSIDQFINGIWSLFWGGGVNEGTSRKFGRVNTNDIFNVMVLSSLASSIGHVYLYRTPVLGASGALSGLMYLLAATYPNSSFRTVFPVPGLNLSILQVLQLFIATNCYFLLSGSGKGIAWAAHLIGMNAGVLYCLFQQYINKRPGFYNPISLSLKTAKSQWIKTYKGLFV